jgi:hypothetical protein
MMSGASRFINTVGSIAGMPVLQNPLVGPLDKVHTHPRLPPNVITIVVMFKPPNPPIL